MGLLFSSIELDATGSLEGLVSAIEHATAMGARSLLILSCDGDDPPTERLNNYLSAVNIPLCGGIFPQIIHRQNAYERGSLVCGLTAATPVAILNGLSTLTAQEIAAATTDHPGFAPAQSYLVLADGASEHLDAFIQRLGTVLNPEKTVLGAAAGSLKTVKKPCLITSRGLIDDAALVIGLDSPVNTGIGLGWEPVAGPFIVTRSQERNVVALDYRPAFDVYRETVESLTNRRLKPSDFFSFASRFPLAIDHFARHPILRSPIQLDGTALVCTGHVPENSAVYIAQGHDQAVIAAALKSAQAALGSPESAAPQRDTVIFDGINRKLYLEEKFATELNSLWTSTSAKADLVGALSMSQIARVNEGTLRLLNNTTVTGVGQGH